MEIFRADSQLSEETDTLAVMEILFKNHITCAELWIDEVYEMMAVEIKGRD